MRICFVTPYPPERDGIGDHTASLVASLRRQGHDSLVVAARPAEVAPADVLTSLPTGAGARDGLLCELGAWRPDVIHVQFGVAAYGTRVPALVRLLARLRRSPAPVVVSLHEVMRDTGLLRGPGRTLYRRIAGLADLVILHTPAARAVLHELAGAIRPPIHVLPLPPQLPPPASTTAAELRVRHSLVGARVLLAFGFIHVDKGLTDLVRALAVLIGNGEPSTRDVRLVVAGAVRVRHGAFRLFELRDRIHLAHARALLRLKRLETQVVFTGYVPDGEIRPWFELAECAVLPYRRIDQSAVAQFAAAIGTPVLASEVGGLSELGDQKTLSFPARHPEELAGALRTFLRESGPRPAPDGTGSDEFTDALLELYSEVSPAVLGAAGAGARG